MKDAMSTRPASSPVMLAHARSAHTWATPATSAHALSLPARSASAMSASDTSGSAMSAQSMSAPALSACALSARAMPAPALVESDADRGRACFSDLRIPVVGSTAAGVYRAGSRRRRWLALGGLTDVGTTGQAGKGVCDSPDFVLMQGRLQEVRASRAGNNWLPALM